MDYLTILATRSLILFQSPPMVYTPPKSPPTTPTANIMLLPPESINMPLHSLLYADTDCAYFLLRHILLHSLPLPIHDSPLALGITLNDQHHDTFHDHHDVTPHDQPRPPYGRADSVGQASRELLAQAESTAWGEIDKAKKFGVALGRWFGNQRGGKGIGEDQLRGLAEKYGLGLVSV
ncbi:hypothetical protein M231_06574 [Tremella mesenterica]|uniref:Uncharacterized protein n=1 Tax=Tremella mesenterica TaxID=5217 RepID=A0A4Q1BBM5_TREME|nr:hypothetical protein M231_06574 [Tremella mesenterica]